MIHAQLFATFRLVAGVKTIDFELAGPATILDGIRRITELHPVLRPHWFDSDGSLHAHVHVFYNGEDVALLPAGLETRLQPEDKLEFFPPVAGG